MPAIYVICFVPLLTILFIARHPSEPDLCGLAIVRRNSIAANKRHFIVGADNVIDATHLDFLTGMVRFSVLHVVEVRF